jgi:nicotinamidase-related amidase
VKLDPKRTALLVIDLQNDRVGEEGAFASSGAAAFTKHVDSPRNAELYRSIADADAPEVVAGLS